MPSSMPSSVSESVQTATAAPAFERFARLGYVARGVIYVLMGVLAIQLARGVGDDKPNQQGAMRQIADQPFGKVLLVLVAIGLAGYTALRLTQALAGRTAEAGDHSTLDRLAAFGSGCAYAVFLAIAISILAGSGGGGGNQAGSTTSDVLGWPGGRVLVTIAGLVFVGVGAYQAKQAITRDFLKDTKTMYMSPKGLKGFTALGVAGHLARAVTFGLIGIFLIKAAVEYDASEAVGIDGALQRLTHQGYGTVALIAVAIGLIAFGTYSITDARYRKI